jgi:hypothetical protein
MLIARIALRLIEDALRWVVLLFRSNDSVQAENLFLRRQLALYIERGVRPLGIDPATRVSLAVLARLFDWRSALVVVQPATMMRWHRRIAPRVLAFGDARGVVSLNNAAELPAQECSARGSQVPDRPDGISAEHTSKLPRYARSMCGMRGW